MQINRKAPSYLLYFFLVLFFFLLFPSRFFFYPGPGLEESLNMGLHLAYKYKLVFGREFISGFGPLGILHTRFPVSVNIFVYILFDIYFLATLWHVLKKILQEHFSYFLVVFVFLFIPLFRIADIEDRVFFFCLFYLFAFLREPSILVYPAQAILLAAIGFFLNVSLGFVGVILLLLVLTYAFIRKKTDVTVWAGSLVLLALLILAGVLLLRVDLKGYILGNFHLLASYGDAMFLPPPGPVWLIQLRLALPVLICFPVLVLWRITEARLKKQMLNGSDELVFYFLTGVSLFLYFKSGFVRSVGHSHLFFQIAACLTGLLYLFGSQPRWRKIFAVYCWLVLLLSSLAINLESGDGIRYSGLIDLSYIPSRFSEVRAYFKGLLAYNGVLRSEEEQFAQSNEFKQVIGSHSVDVIPWDVSTIGLNGLHYDPRPLIQSYLAYNTYLDSLDHEKYSSAGAPEFILFRNESIDGNFAFFDEARAKLALVDRYAADREIGGYLLLRKIKGDPRLVFLGKAATEVRLNEDIPVRKTNNLQFSRIYVRYGDPAALRRFFYQPLAIHIILYLENGETYTYRINKPVLEDGVILNKYIDSKEEFQLLMQGDGRLNADIKKVRIVADESAAGFVSSIQLVNEFYGFRAKTREEAISDSMGLARLMGPKKPVQLDPALLTEDSIRYGLEGANTASRLVKVNGWALLEKEDNRDVTVTVIARSPSGVYEFPTEKIYDPNLASTLKRRDAENCRFMSAADKAQLPPGEYRLGIAIRHANSPQRRIRFTEIHLLNPSNYSVEEVDTAERLPADGIDPKALTSSTEAWAENGRVHVEGWAFLKGEESARSTTHILLSGRGVFYRINTDRTSRQDVSDHYSDPALEYCGYTMDIPDSALLRGEYRVWLEHSCCDGKRRSLKYTDHDLEIGFAEKFVPQPITGDLPVGNFQTAISSYADNQDSLVISGWAIKDMATVKNSMIDIILKDANSKFSVYSSGTNADPRKDVTRFFNNGFDLDNCGFSAKIVKDDLLPGRYRIGIHVHRKGETGAVKFLDLYSVRK